MKTCPSAVPKVSSSGFLVSGLKWRHAVTNGIAADENHVFEMAEVQQQLTLEDLETLHPARVMEIQRTGLLVRGAEDEHQVVLGGRWYQEDGGKVEYC